MSRSKGHWPIIFVLLLALGWTVCGSGSSSSTTPASQSATPTPPIMIGSLTSGLMGSTYSQAIQATGGSGTGYVWTVTTGALPPGLTLTSGTPSATLTGTPTTTGSFAFTVQVRDDQGNTATQGLAMDVRVPQITTVAGTGTDGVSGDGGGATSAQLARPFGIVLGAAGHLYVTDDGNHRVRQVWP